MCSRNGFDFVEEQATIPIYLTIMDKTLYRTILLLAQGKRRGNYL